jgi:hypothetical protein
VFIKDVCISDMKVIQSSNLEREAIANRFGKTKILMYLPVL